ncbi:hypothetical protein CU669_19945 [Paramagnetospirillum kuznetsovii]|uniref:CobQ/CobB/MinD/ParA nucleotide binding domain-containing protein n=1 Tax=Paramagnetospirillum kuznetsovii TaxID=2053833 RepID=A0A364NSW9_9PROT|nr:ParA family partition ATPase [Paramagnetospirillum kuznetsovii]RAU20164.1 hypothetical protein CU669_19945 [Paramagnetospirillum kuznetsovii]
MLKRPKVIAILAQKGGSGKTTTAVHLAVAASQSGLSVAIIDMDKQRSAAHWHESRHADVPLLAESNGSNLPDVIQSCVVEKIDLIIIDTAPHSDVDAVAAARQADYVLIPCRPTILDLRAIAPTVDIVATANVRSAIILTACPSRRSFAEAGAVSESRAALDAYGLPIWPGQISDRVAYHHALIDGQSVTEYEKRGKAAAEISSLWNWLYKEISQ